jgi:HAD superfamily hydrolase (TIGR01509 family)
LSEIFEPWQIALFDEIVLSVEIGRTKPDVQAYQAIAARLDQSPADCVMVDDLARYVTGAREAGMQAIQYISFEQFKQDSVTCMASLRR